MDPDKNSLAAADDTHCRVGNFVITRDGLSGPGVMYKFSAFSSLEMKGRIQDILMLYIFGAILPLFILNHFVLGSGLSEIKWWEWITTPATVLVTLRSAQHLQAYGRLVGLLKTGGSVVLAHGITRANGVKALDAFRRFGGG